MSIEEIKTKYYNDMLKLDIVNSEERGKMQLLDPKSTQKSEATLYCEQHYPQMTTAFKEYQHLQYELLCKKQMDYGPGNIALGTRLSTAQEIKAALMGIVIRANDKMQRLLHLTVVTQREPENESIEDSFMDLAVYSNIALIVKNGKWGR